MEIIGQIENVNIEAIKEGKLKAHGYEWNVKTIKPFTFKGLKRFVVKATKPKGRKLFEMVIYENGTISSAV